MCWRFTQCENVDSRMALIVVLERSTRASTLQLSQANGPERLMSNGSWRQLSPDELKQPCGTSREGDGG